MHADWTAGDSGRLTEGCTPKLYDTGDDGDIAAIWSGE
jgi:hypothetical protein